jgi:hypothetical protein
MTSRFEAAAIAVCLLAAGCGDPLTFGEVAGTYQLGGVNARDLPYLLTATVNCDQWIAEGQLILQESGQFTLTLSGPLDCSRSGGVNQIVGWGFPGTYTIDGAKLHFLSPLPPSVGGFFEFTGVVGPPQRSIGVLDLQLSLGTPVDLAFRR